MSTTTSNPRVAAIRQNIQSSYQSLNDLIERQLVPLEPAQLYQTPIPDEWSLMENIAHIIEFMPYWADEIAKLVAAPGANFGRTLQQPRRVRAIEEHGHDTLATARAELPQSYASLDQVLGTLKDSDLDLWGLHPKYGDQTLDWFIKDFLTDHMASHLEQMKRCLAALQEN